MPELTPRLEMMENRSFDGVMGWLYENGEQPDRVIPPVDSKDKTGNYSRSFNGLEGIDLEQFKNQGTLKEEGKVFATFDLPPKRGVSHSNAPNVLPGEFFDDVNQQFYRNPEKPAEGAKAPMTGFLQNFIKNVEKHASSYTIEQKKAAIPQIMETYTASQLPVLNGLAKTYATSDLWFASIPSQTNINRAFFNLWNLTRGSQ